MATYINRLPPQEFLRRYLKVAPVALAVFRSIEAKYISSTSMKRPILDLGCGFGEFAGVFFDRQVETGLDISWKELVTASKSKRYKNLTCVDARNMPYANNSFATVLSVSVFEHITKVDEVVKEVFRVLKPKGQLILTINSSKISSMLFWPKVFRSIGLHSLAEFYTKSFHRVFRHVTLRDKKQWEKILVGSGFKIITSREIISPRATEFFDYMLITSWPSQIFKIVRGKRWAWRPEWFREWLVRRFSPIVQSDETEGSNLFIVAYKP